MSDSSYLTNPSRALGDDGQADFGRNGAAMHQPPLTDRLTQGAHHTIDRVAETAAPHIQRLEEALAEAKAQLKEQARHARDKGDEWAEDLRTTVRRNPLTAVFASVAIGALIARITR